MAVRSMTGFARVQGECALGLVAVEMRSVNHRYLDIFVRLPRDFALPEEEVKSIVREQVMRGRVEITLKLQAHVKSARAVTFNTELLCDYRDKLVHLAHELEVDPRQNISLEYLLTLPGVVEEQDGGEVAVEAHERVKELLKLGVNALVAAREQEGARLCEDVAARLEFIKTCVSQIDKRALTNAEGYRQRFMDNIKRIAPDIVLDSGRLETEVALWADRASITEEVVRLNTHMHNFGQFLTQQAVGRKMDFYLQEMNREVNTLGSKSADVGISQLVIEIKSELEKVREQVQNLE